MNKSNLFHKVALAGVAVAISATGIATAPAQALTIADGSFISWDNSTTDFFSDINFTAPPSDTFSFTYEPPGFDSTIGGVTGDFATWFDTGDVVDFSAGPMSQLTANFTQIDPLPGSPPALAYYQLQNDVVFDFEEQLNENGFTGLDLKYVIPAGVQYNVTGQTANAVTVDFCIQTCEAIPFWIADDGTGPMTTGAISTGDVEDLAVPGGGNFGIESATTEKTPEPASILGLLAIGGLGLGLKRKKQSKQLSV